MLDLFMQTLLINHDDRTPGQPRKRRAENNTLRRVNDAIVMGERVNINAIFLFFEGIIYKYLGY